MLSGQLVDDSSGFFVGAQGCAYYEDVSIGARTLTGWDDTESHKPRAPNDC